MLNDIDEATLLARLRAGDEAAFELLVRTYGGRMLSVARGMLRSEEDARDAVQSAYASAFAGLPSFQGTSQLGTWLHRIVVNAALMRLRRRRRKPEESIDALLPSFLDDGHHVERFSDWAAQADRLLEEKRARATVREAIASLPETHRVVLMLRDIEELPTETVAAELGISPNAVKIRLHRARQALGTVLRLRMNPGETTWPTHDTRRATLSHSPSPSPAKPARRSPSRGPSFRGECGCRSIGDCTRMRAQVTDHRS
jgi:RNA polymerase sigma-70 factor, ECF subfamily